MKIKLFQQGGGIPAFNYWTPVQVGGDRTEVTSGGKESSKDKDDLGIKDIFDLLKNLKGLPSDVDYFTQEISRFFNNPFYHQGNTSSLVSLYTTILRRANNFLFSSAQFEKSKENIVEKGGLDEIAITPYGLVYAKDAEGNLKIMNPEQYYNGVKEGKYQKVTNDELLHDRAYNSPLDDSVFQVINSGTGMKAVTERVNDMINTLGSTEYKESNLTRGEKNGFVLLANLAARGGIQPASLEGLFKSELITKEQEPQVMAALRYVYTNLTPSEQALLKTKTGSDNEALKYIYDLYTAKTSVNISIENTPYKDDDNTDIGKIKSNPLLQMINGEGGTQLPLTIVTNDGNEGFTLDAIHYPSVLNVKSDCSVEELLSLSGIQGIMYGYGKRHITFGDLRLNPEDLQHVMYSNQGLSMAYLPAITTADGAKEVNFAVLDEYKEACRDFSSKTGLTSPNLIKTEDLMNTWTLTLRDHNLDEYIGLDGKVNTSLFSLFAVVDAYTTDKIKIDEKSRFIEKIDKPDQNIQEMLIKGLSTNSQSDKNDGKYNYKVDVKNHIQPFELKNDRVYKGNVFIPISNDPNAAINSYGDLIYQNQVSEYERLTLMWNKRNNQNSNSSSVL